MASRMVERRNDEAAEFVARIGDSTPAGFTAFGERGTFVRPITRVNTRTFGDDDAAPTACTSFVVGTVAIGEGSIIRAQIGDVRSEHDAVLHRSTAEGQRLE